MGKLIGEVPLTSGERVARYHETPKGRLTHLMIGVKKRSKERNIELGIERNDLLELFEQQKGKCALTGVSFDLSVRNGGKHICNPYSMSVDRIDNKFGYIKNNVRLICSIANVAKGRWSDIELIEFCKKVIEHNG